MSVHLDASTQPPVRESTCISMHTRVAASPDSTEVNSLRSVMFLLIIYVVRSQRAMSMHTIVIQALIILER